MGGANRPPGNGVRVWHSVTNLYRRRTTSRVPPPPSGLSVVVRLRPSAGSGPPRPPGNQGPVAGVGESSKVRFRRPAVHHQNSAAGGRASRSGPAPVVGGATPSSSVGPHSPVCSGRRAPAPRCPNRFRNAGCEKLVAATRCHDYLAQHVRSPKTLSKVGLSPAARFPLFSSPLRQFFSGGSGGPRARAPSSGTSRNRAWCLRQGCPGHRSRHGRVPAAVRDRP